MRAATEQTYKERILRVLVHIQEHLDEPLPLGDLARVACFSPHHFHHIFGALVGESVKEHIRRLRLERAAYRLQFGNQPITDIAFAAGFASVRQFNDTVQAVFGTTPSGLRAARRDRGASEPGVITLRLPYREPIELAFPFDFLGAHAVPALESYTDATFTRVLRTPGGAALVSLTPGDGAVS